MASRSFRLLLVGGYVLTFVTVFAVAGSFDGEAAIGQARRTASAVVEAATYYPGCNAVRAAGKAPLYRGQPGYRESMDGDNDGIVCEPHPGAGFIPDGMRHYPPTGRRRH
ncbi:excalibur calcium-binding domain-containing protein [Sphingomonas solaris]|uniref:Excalibur calcium-binding domain-containing protein n=1 Tax=Alterirhizorhabdus solaris TaxID=2529389 RepID=A0A558QW43_9SPHN|nr:excalibur calcium-binding domain-containing protein [Sphingomonas solaris]TVV71376.1 excalibur calcium-binding domain-containing protein [Sphingomonas solaris]